MGMLVEEYKNLKSFSMSSRNTFDDDEEENRRGTFVTVSSNPEQFRMHSPTWVNVLEEHVVREVKE